MDERMTTEELAKWLNKEAGILDGMTTAKNEIAPVLRTAARRLTLLAKVVEAVKKQGDNSPNTERALAALAADLTTPTTEER